MDRPFYSTYAWAYDLLAAGPVKGRVDFIATHLTRRGKGKGSQVLDAGCGTGTYALALAGRGFKVVGVDLSKELIAEARRKAGATGVSVDFAVGDILYLPEGLSMDAILCRGVLNDLTRADARRAVFPSFAGAMSTGGVLVLDVREWHATAVRKRKHPVSERTVTTKKGLLTFESVTRLLPETHSLAISETHVLRSLKGEDSAAFDFEMRCWTREELTNLLVAAGFDKIEYFGDYDAKKPAGATDRLVAVATLG